MYIFIYMYTHIYKIPQILKLNKYSINSPIPLKIKKNIHKKI